MAGLDTRGVVDGFMRGYAFMENVEDRKLQRERQATLDSQNAERFEMDKQNHRQQQQLNGLRIEDIGIQRERQTVLDDRAGELHQMAQDNHAQRQQLTGLQIENQEQSLAAQQRNQDVQRIRQGYQMALYRAQQTPGLPWEQAFDAGTLALFDKPSYRYLRPDYLASPETGQSIEQFKRLMNPEDPAAMQDPETISAANFFLSPSINTDREGKPLVGHRNIVGVVPGKNRGTVIPELELEDGSRHPMTQRRASEAEGDNTLLQQEVGPILQKVAAADQLRGVMKAVGWLNDSQKPYIETFYDENGQEYKAQYDYNNGRWVRIGGSRGLKGANGSDYEIIKTTDDMGNDVIAGRFNKLTGELEPLDITGFNQGNKQQINDPKAAAPVMFSGDKSKQQDSDFDLKAFDQEVVKSGAGLAMEEEPKPKKRMTPAERNADAKAFKDARRLALNYIRTDQHERGYAERKAATAAIQQYIQEGRTPWHLKEAQKLLSKLQ
ncbi:MAG: hypothetical protein ACPGMR_03170 [Pontibacterium sp.]